MDQGNLLPKTFWPLCNSCRLVSPHKETTGTSRSTCLTTMRNDSPLSAALLGCVSPAASPPLRNSSQYVPIWKMTFACGKLLLSFQGNDGLHSRYRSKEHRATCAKLKWLRRLTTSWYKWLYVCFITWYYFGARNTIENLGPMGRNICYQMAFIQIYQRIFYDGYIATRISGGGGVKGRQQTFRCLVTSYACVSCI